MSTPFNAAWRFLRKRNNREILTLLGAGVAAVASAAWLVFTYSQTGGICSLEIFAGFGACGDVFIGGNVDIRGGN